MKACKSGLVAFVLLALLSGPALAEIAAPSTPVPGKKSISAGVVSAKLSDYTASGQPVKTPVPAQPVGLGSDMTVESYRKLLGSDASKIDSLLKLVSAKPDPYKFNRQSLEKVHSLSDLCKLIDERGGDGKAFCELITEINVKALAQP